MRIFLTGFPAAGKTFLGKMWAEKQGLQFYDLDTLIAAEERMTVSEIFSAYGESYFREKEAAVLRNTDRFHDCIIACGGGTPCFFDNADWMARNGVVVFLDQSKENIENFLEENPGVRPLIQRAESPKEFIGKYYEQRLPFYQKAHIRLAPEKLNADGFTEILNFIGNA